MLLDGGISVKIVRFDIGDGAARIGTFDDDSIYERATTNPLDAPAAPIVATYRASDVRLLAPIARPHKYLAIGLNYALHSKEAGFDLPTHPVIFNKQTSCIIGPGDGIRMPSYTETLDYEGELGVVIGTTCRNVAERNALEVIAGYVVLNDVTVREWQRRSRTITLAKSADTHGPVGPWLVTADEVPDPQQLQIRTWIGNDLVQNFNTSGMLFCVRRILATLSEIFTLEPGDLIATGTGEGVGSARQPQRWLRVGETVTVEIDGLGSLSNPIIPDPLLEKPNSRAKD
jgi:2-keto-4-pentenoate hydratase/2-oxohepta-3-ene-1,7-dioic acid hydratase in catechol pathway